jgi:hypothetical protein
MLRCLVVSRGNSSDGKQENISLRSYVLVLYHDVLIGLRAATNIIIIIIFLVIKLDQENACGIAPEN